MELAELFQEQQIEGHELIFDEEAGGWLEIDEYGTPMGIWGWADDLEEWVFTPMPPPMGELPQTGQPTTPVVLLGTLGFSLIVTGAIINRNYKRRKTRMRT